MGARSESKALEAINEIKQKDPDAEIEFLNLDLSSLVSVVAAARDLQSKTTMLHGLINNAGIMGVPFALTADGFESQFQTNYLSHWLLTHLLLPLLISTSNVTHPGDVRIVNVTSGGHNTFAPDGGIVFDDIQLQSKGPMVRYGQSKLGNVLHAKELHRRFGPKDGDPKAGEIWVTAVHPGNIYTNLTKQATGSIPRPVLQILAPLGRCLGILDEQAKGGLSSLFAIASTDFKRSDSGAYIVPYAKIGTPSAYAQDPALALKLWDWTVLELEKKGVLGDK
ncbi:hypothetical protein H072_8542 [Dactylellina haptotyla CBS 200.50]|uniref:NAD(P)-binding protein n=1 Tax=Dactylellina haptotyla (strain CBS 200.50) TaxID=1284197 RepID=S8A9B6_DACHA|nr:hypothetical protein H072_8542 [Dactylellina haptotyla CBS 200.50]